MRAPVRGLGLMRTPTRALRRLTVALLATLPIMGCGTAGGKDVVASVAGGGAGITKAELAHWTLALAGADYYQAAQAPEPSGLVSAPPDNAAFVAPLRSFPPKAKAKANAKARGA